ncbi:DUF998 domain-containing protein [Haladaptatus sp. NG-WS-4]
MENTTEKFRIATGILTPLVALGTFGVGAALSTTYTWPGEPFSVIGGEGNFAALFFNAGLVVTGLLALPFATRLWTASSRAVAVLYALVGVTLVGAGLFPIGGDSIAHELFGAGIFLGIWLLLWTAGILEWRSGAPREGATVIALGSITLVVWLPYDFGLTWAQIGWGAAEVVVVVCFGVWSVSTASKLWRCAPRSTAGKRAENPIRT